MKRLYPWLIGAGLLGAGCSPKNDVMPGAPVLTLMTIVESGGITDIKGGEGACPGTAQDGAKCDPMADGLCESTKSWCRCLLTNPMDPSSEADWSCHFEPTSVVIVTFDRLLDTEPLDYDLDAALKMGEPLGRTDVATITSMPGKAPEALVDYASNGSETELIFKIFSNTIHGPRLIISGSPALPSGSTINLALDKTKVRAKDHTSLFVGSGVIGDGTLTFATAPFAASIAVPVAPPPPPPDAGAPDDADAEADGGVADGATDDGGNDDGGAADAASSDAGEAGGDGGAADSPAPPPLPEPVMAGMQVVTVTFNNLTDQAQIKARLSVTVNGTPATDLVVKATDTMDPTAPSRAYGISPQKDASWPAGAVITITVGADAADLQGVTLGAPASATFVTEP